MNTFIANIVNIVHKFIILFVIGVPLVGNIPIMLINFVFMLGIMVHWYFNSNVCALTVLEKFIRGTPYDNETFFGQLFGKVYSIQNDSNIYWIGMYILIAITITRILYILLSKKRDVSE